MAWLNTSFIWSLTQNTKPLQTNGFLVLNFGGELPPQKHYTTQKTKVKDNIII